jgi:hypothetical protein
MIIQIILKNNIYRVGKPSLTYIYPSNYLVILIVWNRKKEDKMENGI